jgi:hypothetical protein
MDWTGANGAFSGNYNPDSTTGGLGAAGSFHNQGNPGVMENIMGQASAPDQVYFGGTPQAAGGITNYYQQQGRMANAAGAAQIGNTGTNAINAQMGQAGAAYGNAAGQNQQMMNNQYDAMSKLQQAASGYGPSAAQAQLQQGTEAAMNSNMAMANSTRGQAGMANAQKNALGQNGMQGQQAANQSAQLRAQEMQAAQSQYATQSTQAQNNMAAQQQGYAALGMQGANALQGNAQAQAQLQQSQNQLGQQSQLGYEQLGFNAQNANMQAQMNNQNNAYQMNMSNAKNASNSIGGLIGAVGGAMMLSDERSKTNIKDGGHGIDTALQAMHPHQYEYKQGMGQAGGQHTGIMAQELASTDAGSALVGAYPGGGMGVKVPEATNFALAAVARLNEKIDNLQRGNVYGDAKLREPGGGAGWTLREEPDFILAKNESTGEMRKLMTSPLAAGEHKQALAPHGAGPISQTNGSYGDMFLGSEEAKKDEAAKKTGATAAPTVVIQTAPQAPTAAPSAMATQFPQGPAPGVVPQGPPPPQAAPGGPPPPPAQGPVAQMPGAHGVAPPPPMLGAPNPGGMPQIQTPVAQARGPASVAAVKDTEADGPFGALSQKLNKAAAGQGEKKPEGGGNSSMQDIANKYTPENTVLRDPNTGAIVGSPQWSPGPGNAWGQGENGWPAGMAPSDMGNTRFGAQ